MSDHGLSIQQLAVICALCSGATMTAAAEQAGVHRNTITNWRRNLLPFQRALADAQYDRALLFREKLEELVGLACQTIHDILADPKAPAIVRLKAALAIIQTASTPPLPKKQIELVMETVTVIQNPSTHNAAQSTPPVAPSGEPSAPEVANLAPPNAHNSAQRIHNAKTGRNDTCPCGSGKKYKRCCLEKTLRAQHANAA